MAKKWIKKINYDYIKNSTTEYLKEQLGIMTNEINTTVFPKQTKSGLWIKKETAIACRDYIKTVIEQRENESRAKCDKMRQEYQQNDAPAAVVEKTIPNMAEKTEPETDHTVETESNKKPKIPKMAKPQKTKTAPKPKKTKTARKPKFKITDYEQFWKSIM